jgi:transposase
LWAWELHQLGWTQTRIAQALGVTQGAVSQWLQRAQVGGVQALQAHPAPGPPRRLSPNQLEQLPCLLAQGAEAFGFLGAVWTRRRVAQLIKEQFSVRYHPRHVGRLLQQMGWSPQRRVVQASQRDEAQIATWYEDRWPLLKKSACAKTESSSL